MKGTCTAKMWGPDCSIYTLTLDDLSIEVSQYGATLVSVHTPDRDGRLANIVLGFDTLAAYQRDHPYFGAIVGPCANRISHGSFVIDGNQFKIPPNNGIHALHGGPLGFSRRLWHAERPRGARTPSVLLTLETKDGDGGFPGSLLATVTYTLLPNELKIEYEVETDAPTICNLTSHPYWNLKGAGRGDILDHVLQINADCYTPTDDLLIPTGQILGVHHTALDFTVPHLIRTRMFGKEAIEGGGFDHNFVLRGGLEDASITQAAILRERTSGRQIEFYTSQPGLQLYTGNGLDGSLVGSGGPFVKYGGVCLEAQHFPDAPNHEFFPSVELRPGQTYKHINTLKFSVAN